MVMTVVEFLATAENDLVAKLKKSSTEKEMKSVLDENGILMKDKEINRLFSILTRQIDDEMIDQIVAAAGNNTARDMMCSFTGQVITMLGTPSCVNFKSKNNNNCIVTCKNCEHCLS